MSALLATAKSDWESKNKHKTGNEYQYRAGVGGFIPGYKGHRPKAKTIWGETSFGGVPRDMERAGLRPSPGQGFGKRETTSHMELGNNYRRQQVDKEEAFLAFAPRAVKLNSLLKDVESPKTWVDEKQAEYLKRAAECEKKRIPFEQRGGWPTPHGRASRQRRPNWTTHTSPARVSASVFAFLWSPHQRTCDVHDWRCATSPRLAPHRAVGPARDL